MAARFVDKKAKRDQILDAALQVFSRRGFAQATMQEIAAAADIGKGTLYEYFRSKDEIIHSTWLAFMRQMDKQLEGILATSLPATEKLRGVLAAFMAVIQDESFPVIRIIFSFWAEAMRDTSQQNNMFADMNHYYRLYRTAMAELVAQGIREGEFRSDLDPLTTASTLIGMLDGLLAQWILDPDALDYACMDCEIPELVIRGIASSRNGNAAAKPATRHRRRT